VFRIFKFYFFFGFIFLPLFFISLPLYPEPLPRNKTGEQKVGTTLYPLLHNFYLPFALSAFGLGPSAFRLPPSFCSLCFFVWKNCAIFPYEKKQTKEALSDEDKVLPFALAQKPEVQEVKESRKAKKLRNFSVKKNKGSQRYKGQKGGTKACVIKNKRRKGKRQGKNCPTKMIIHFNHL